MSKRQGLPRSIWSLTLGNSASGEFLHSLNVTDIHTTWVESRAVMGKSQIGVLNAMQDIERALPFKLLGIDSDNGSEFINDHLKTFCDQKGIQLTRGRPYKKDDNAQIEQKNYTHVRKILGYLRYDSGPVQKAINELYQNELRIFQVLFLPAMKLRRKPGSAPSSSAATTNPRPPWSACSMSPGRSGQSPTVKRLRTKPIPLRWPNASSKKLERIFEMANHRVSPQPKPPHSSFPTRREKQILGEIAKIFGPQIQK